MKNNKTKKQQAREAGLWYLLMGVTGAFGILYMASSILVPDDAAATATNLMNSEWMYRLSILSGLVCQTAFIFLVLALNRLFEGVNVNLSKMMKALILVGAPIAILNYLNMVGAMLVVNGADYWSAFDQEQRNALVMLFLELYQYGLVIVQIFWGLWLLPLGLLCIQSKLIPKWIGWLLIVGCFCYLLIVLIGLLFPEYNESASAILMLPLAIGEFSVIGWLLAKGVKEQK